MTDYYRLGIECDEENGYERPPSDQVGLFSPSNVKNTLNEIKASADRLDALAKSSRISVETLSAWDAWYKGWSAFYSDVIDSWISMVKLSLNETYDQAQEYKAKVDKWRTALEKEAGTKLAGPRVEEAPSGINWKYALIGGGVIAALVAGAMVAKEVGGTVRAFKE